MEAFEQRAAVDEWVSDEGPDYGELEGVDRKYSYLLSECQVLYRPGRLTQHFRNIVRIAKAADFPIVNPVQVTVNPAYEKGRFHSFRIVRDGKATEIGPSLEFVEIQREKELENRVYTGLKTYLAHVDGIQIGDIVDLSFSIESDNPLFRSNFTYQHLTRIGLPLWRLSLSVRYENPGRTCDVRIVDNFRDWTSQRLPSGGVYRFEKEGLAALDLEEFIPPGENPLSYVEFSDYGGWEEFGRNLLEGYRVVEPDDLDLQGYVAEITQAADEDRRIEDVVNHVKTKIAYTSISIGEHSYLPHPPADVLRQNYGDCKDKSLLLKALLGTMGVESDVILVHATEGHNLGPRLISLACFNHAILRLKRGEEQYFVDPTDALSLFRFAAPVEWDFGSYLDTGSFRLLKMGRARNNLHARQVTEKFVIQGDEARIGVRDEYRFQAFRGPYSNYLSHDLDSIVKRYFEFYRLRYPDLSLAEDEEPRYTVYPEEQRIEFNISFVARGVWQVRESDRSRLFLSFYPSLLNEYLIAPKAQERRYNHLWPHPVEFRYSFDIDYDFDASMGRLDEYIAAETFECSVSTVEKPRKYLYVLDYSSRSERILAGRYNEEKVKIEKFLNELGFTISKSRSLLPRIEVPSIWVKTLMQWGIFFGILILARILYGMFGPKNY